MGDFVLRLFSPLFSGQHPELTLSLTITQGGPLITGRVFGDHVPQRFFLSAQGQMSALDRESLGLTDQVNTVIAGL
jgi:hypothetical protein